MAVTAPSFCLIAVRIPLRIRRRLPSGHKYYSVFLTDTFDVIDALSATVTARYNIAKGDLADRNGDALNGNNRFTHFDPSVGASKTCSTGVTRRRYFGRPNGGRRAGRAGGRRIWRSRRESPLSEPRDAAGLFRRG